MHCPGVGLWASMLLSFECGFVGDGDCGRNGTYIEKVFANVGTEMLTKLHARIFALL